MAPLGAPQAPTVPTTSPVSNKDPKEQKQDNLFSNPVFPPMLDMSSTQALLHMVRTANAAQNAAELETYLKGKFHQFHITCHQFNDFIELLPHIHFWTSWSTSSAICLKLHKFLMDPFPILHQFINLIPCVKYFLSCLIKGANKRDAGVTSPLDLSSPGGFAPRKRQRTESRRSGSVSPKPKATPRPSTPPPVRCPSLCGHMPCGDGQAVNRWTIEDVVNYVSSIDICAEYAQVSF